MRTTAYRIVAGLGTLAFLGEGLSHLFDDWAAPHRVHDVGHTVVAAFLVAAMASQPGRRRPPAGLQVLGAIAVAAGLADLVGQRFGGVEVIAVVAFGLLYALHPDRASVTARGAGPDRVLLAAAGVAALALAPYFVHQSELQRTVVDPVHPELGYWTWVSTSVVLFAAALAVAALRIEGWQLPVWLTVAGLTAFGAVSLALPHETGSFGILGGAAALLAAVLLIGVVVAGDRRTLALPTPVTSRS